MTTNINILYNKNTKDIIINKFNINEVTTMKALSERLDSLTKEQMSLYGKNVMLGGGTPGPCLVSGKGIELYDSDGKSYIDCTSQSWAMYLGFANEEIREAVYEHMTKMSHIHQGFDTPTRYLLAHKLASIAPKNLNRVSFTVGGGPAIEAAMKIALKNVSGAKHFITLMDAYHGTTLGTIGASWVSTKSAGKYLGASSFLSAVNTNFIRVSNPYCYRCPFGKESGKCGYECAAQLEDTIRRGSSGPVAGVILEPLQASGGQIPFPKEYLKKVRSICDEYGAVLIYDEIQTYCRIGEFFAADYYDVEPDVIVLGKGIGAGFPIAAIIIHDRLKGFEMAQAEELHTFANNSVSQLAALKQIEIIERDNLLENTREVGKYICEGLTKLKERFWQIGDIRQVGLHIGVEMVGDPTSKVELDVERSKEIKERAMENGLILGTAGYKKNIFKVKPPLITTKDQADVILERFEKTLKQVL